MPSKLRFMLSTALLSVGATMGASPVMAQAISAEEAATLRAQIDALRAQVSTLEARLDAATGPVAAPTPAPTPAVAAATPAPTAAQGNDTTTNWRGAPQLASRSGFTFKPRGRMQVDAGSVDLPDNPARARIGFGTEIRRLFLGVDGDLPGGFGYRLEADFADNDIALTDAYLQYETGNLELTLGQHKPAWSMEEQTSDLFTSFSERAAFTQAWGFERRVGLSGKWSSGPVILSAGVFSDDVDALTNDQNNSWSIGGRGVVAPRIGDTQLHLAGWLHSRTLNDAGSSVRYRARPFAHVTDTRLVDTGSFSASGEWNWGAELAAIRGRYHFAGEYSQMIARRAGMINPRFDGGYAEVGMFLTNDTRNYRGGAFDRVSPKRAISDGGFGALELNLRYDWLDLNSRGINGGEQDIYAASLTWIPIGWVRFIAGYGRVNVSNTRPIQGLDGDYSADVVTMRAQLDF